MYKWYGSRGIHELSHRTPLCRYPGGDLLSYLQRCNERGVTTVIGKMQDRVAYGGILATVWSRLTTSQDL